MKHGEQLAPLIAAALDDRRRRAARTSPRSRSASAPARSPACASGWSPRAPSASCSASRSTASARSTCSRLRGVGTGPHRRRFLVATDARRKEVYLASYDVDGRAG